jgi:DNA-binding LacI/PurR family transcriptional regulator
VLDDDRGIPRFLQLYQLLKSEIIAGKYACFEAIPSQQQLIDAHRVSLITVRRALEKLTEEGYITRRQGKGCYVAPETDWRINRSRVTQIGVVVSSIVNSFFPEIINGMEGYLHAAGAQLTIAHSQWQPELEKSHIQRMLENGCNGLLISPSQTAESYERLRDQGVPFVLFNHYFPEADFPYVITDDRNGTKAAVSYLIAKGHRKIGAIIGGAGKATARDRWEGFKAGFAEAGLEFRESWVSWQRNFTYEEGVEAARELLLREPALTAVFGSSEALATGAVGYLLNRGYQVPRDISVVAFGDSDTSRFFKIPLTTVSQPTAKMGELAAGLLLAKIQGERIESDRIVLPCDLVIRESTAAVKDGE